MKPTREQLIAWGRAGGVARSAAKAKASRQNGKLGGWPLNKPKENLQISKPQ